MKTTEQQQALFIDAAEDIAEIIRIHTVNSPLKGIPSGHLYARLMSSMSFDLYTAFIRYLTHHKIVRQHPSFLLEYIRTSAPFAETTNIITEAQKIAERIAARKTQSTNH
jgi:hypothetical protein